MESLLMGSPCKPGPGAPGAAGGAENLVPLTLGTHEVPLVLARRPQGGSQPPCAPGQGGQPRTPPSPGPRPPVCPPQPVPHSGSSGYGSLGSNGSHEHLMSQTSSSDSNGHEEARRRRAVGPSPPPPTPHHPRPADSVPRLLLKSIPGTDLVLSAEPEQLERWWEFGVAVT